MLIDEKALDALSKGIARAMVTAHDDLVDEAIANWPAEYRGRVPQMGTSTQQQRYEAFRANRQSAERAIEQKAAEEEKNKQMLADIQAKHAAAVAAWEEQEALRHKGDLAKWNADAEIARLNGREAPPKPRDPMTYDEKVREEHRASYRDMF